MRSLTPPSAMAPVDELPDDIAAPGALRFGHKPALDGLRAVAVVSVMAYHFGASWAPGGFLGVDLFFVLSGYLITSLLLVEWSTTRTIDLAAFWARRARRLLPALFIVLAAIALWSMLAARSDRLDAIRADSLWTLFYGANWHFITSGQSYFDLFSEASPLRHAWSLAIEEQFYLVWPLVAFVCLRFARGRHWLLAAVCVVGTGASVLVMTSLYEPNDPSRVYYGTDARASQLLVGALLAIVLLRAPAFGDAARRSVVIAGTAGAAFCVWAIVVAHDTSSWLYHGGYLAFAVASAAVIWLAVSPRRSWLRAVLVPKPIRWVGAISYGLYLWHWPVAIAISEPRTGLSGWELASVRVLVTVAFAACSYYVVELPIRRGRWLHGPIARVAAPVAGVATAVIIVVSTAGATPPPSFLVADNDDVVRAIPAPEPSVPTHPTETALGLSRILVLGDSVADTLDEALREVAARRGVVVESVTRPGCGMTAAVPLWSDGRPTAWGPACAEGTAGYQANAVRDTTPDTVVWLSTWETADQIFGGTTQTFGTPGGDAALLAELEAAHTRLTAGGARVILVTLPTPALDGEVQPLRPDEGERRRHLNALFRRFAAQHPGTVGVADLASIVCPDGDPCSGTVDGVELRPRDGNHFEGDGPAWVGPRLYREILDAVARVSTAA